MIHPIYNDIINTPEYSRIKESSFSLDDVVYLFNYINKKRFNEIYTVKSALNIYKTFKNMNKLMLDMFGETYPSLPELFQENGLLNYAVLIEKKEKEMENQKVDLKNELEEEETLELFFEENESEEKQNLSETTQTIQEVSQQKGADEFEYDSEDLIMELIIKASVYSSNKTWIPVKRNVLLKANTIDIYNDKNTTAKLESIIQEDPDLVIDFIEYTQNVKTPLNPIKTLRHAIVMMGPRHTIQFIRDFYDKEIFKTMGFFLDKKDLSKENRENTKMFELASILDSHHYFRMLSQNFKMMVSYRNLGKNIALQFLNRERETGTYSTHLKKISKKRAEEIAENNNHLILDMIMENWQIATTLKQRYGIGSQNKSGILSVYNYFNIIQFLMNNINRMASMTRTDFPILKTEFKQILSQENFIGLKEKDIIQILSDTIQTIQNSFNRNLHEYGIFE